ncbi:MAG: phage capsid family protein [Candidatus Nitrosocosmicus sp.]
MAYDPSVPNAFDTSLIPYDVRSEYFTELIETSPFINFTGSTKDSVIQVVYLENGSGGSTTFSFKQELDYTKKVRGFGQISGNGQQVKFFQDKIEVEIQSFSDQLQGVQVVKLQTPIQVYDALKPSLITAHKRDVVHSLLKSATFDSYSANFGAGPVADRVQYGTDATPGANYNASMITAADALAGNVYGNGGLSVDAIKNMRRMAMQGGVVYEREKRINPYEQKTLRGAPCPMFVYFMSPSSYKSLEGDPQWNQYYNRALIELPNQPSGLNGSLFRGQIDGVLVYEVQELEKFRLGTDQGFARSNAWNLFCGAQAFGLAWHGIPWFEQEFRNMRTEVQMAYLEFRGEKPIKFPSFTNPNVAIENAIIHHIVRL